MGGVSDSSGGGGRGGLGSSIADEPEIKRPKPSAEGIPAEFAESVEFGVKKVRVA